MKKLISLLLSLALLTACMAIPAIAEEADADVKSILELLKSELDAVLR